MSALDRVKLLADIAKVSSEIYATIVDKARSTAADKAKIADLERQLADLKNKNKEK